MLDELTLMKLAEFLTLKDPDGNPCPISLSNPFWVNALRELESSVVIGAKPAAKKKRAAKKKAAAKKVSPVIAEQQPVPPTPEEVEAVIAQQSA